MAKIKQLKEQEEKIYPITKGEAVVLNDGRTVETAISQGTGTKDYNALENKPTVNSVELAGNKTTADLNLISSDEDNKLELGSDGGLFTAGGGGGAANITVTNVDPGVGADLPEGTFIAVYEG